VPFLDNAWPREMGKGDRIAGKEIDR
jgi:hypothetical protein